MVDIAIVKDFLLAEYYSKFQVGKRGRFEEEG